MNFDDEEHGMNTGLSKTHRIFWRWLCCALAMVTCGLVSAADDEAEKASDIEQEYEVGVYILDEDAWRFGKYTGLIDEGTELLLDFRLESRPEWDSGETRNWSLLGWRLGLDSRRLAFEYENQGSWEFGADYRELPNYRFEGGVSPFDGIGSNVLTLPANWVAPMGGGTGSFETLEENLAPVSSYWKRKRFDLYYDRQFNSAWALNVTWRHETKDGDDTFGGVIGYNGMNPRAVVLPSPIEWETDIMEATLHFGTARYQLGAAVYASWFGNDYSSLSWQNPYGARSTWAPAAGYPRGQGLASLDPDNEAMQFRLYGGLNLSPTSRVSADIAFGTMEQDDPLFGYTVNDRLMVHTPLPANSANAKIDTTHANLRFTTRLFRRLGLVANYTLDKRDNQTPRHTWIYIGGDAEDQKPPSEGRINLPFSYEKQQWDLTATWRAGHGVRLKGGVEWDNYSRTYAEVLDSDEARVFAGLNIGTWSKASFSFDVIYSDRDVDEYVHNRPYLAYRVPGSVSDDDYDNLPALRKYNQADRSRREYRARADFFPVERFSFALSGARYDDDYDDPTGQFGLQNSDINSWSVDAGFYPSEALSITAYYTNERFDTVQTGRMWTGKIQAGNPANNWQADAEDKVDTWNISLTLNGFGEDSSLGDRLRLGLDLTHSNVESDIVVDGAENILTAPLPTLINKMDSWSLWASFDINERAALRLSYESQQLSSNDFALDDVPIDGSPSVLLLGQAAPDYDVSLVMLYLAYRY